MTISIDNAFVKQFEREVHEAYQRMGSKLRQTVRVINNKYVRRMRPTFGYLMALTWAAQMLALAYVVVFDTGQASLVIEAMESLGTIWTVGLSVLGIYVYKRSEEKKKIISAARATGHKARKR